MLQICVYFCYSCEHGIISVLFCAGNTGLFMLYFLDSLKTKSNRQPVNWIVTACYGTP